MAGFEGNDGCGVGCGGTVFLGDIVVLLLELEGHRGKCVCVKLWNRVKWNK